MQDPATGTVILECMQRNQEVLQAYWNLKNYSQGGCGLAGFLHNCWCWVVRLVEVVEGAGCLCQHSAIEAFSNTDSGLMSAELCSYKDACFKCGFSNTSNLLEDLLEVCEQHSLSRETTRRDSFIMTGFFFFFFF